MALRLDIKKKLDANSARVKAVDVHPDLPWVLAALYDGNALIWDYKAQTKVHSFEVAPNLPLRAGKFIVRKQWIVIGSDDFQVRCYNFNTMEKVSQFEAHRDYIRCIDVHPTLPYILTSSDDMQIKMWNWSKNWACERVFEGHVHFVMMVKFNPKDPQRFASASLDSTIKFWGITGSTPHFSLEGHDKGVNCIDFYYGGDKPYIASGSDDRSVKIWDYQTKACVQTLTGHTKNISAVAFHPRLPLIITASEDHSVRLWHNTTYRLSSTLNYGKDRAWCVATSHIGQKVAIGYDDGTVVIKVGHERPVMSMDSNGKCIWTVNNNIFTSAVRGIANEANDGDVLRMQSKEMGSCEVFPQSLSHNAKGNFFAVCGNGEYIIYTTIRLRNKAFGSALDFVWNASGSGDYAIREGSSRIKTFRNFSEAESFQPPFSAEGIFGGRILGVRSNDFVVFYDWEKCNLIRRIDVCPKNIYWNDSADLVVFACEKEYYVLKYDSDAVAAAFASGSTPSDGVPAAFELIHKISEKVRTGLWVGDCFVYTTASKLNYFIGGEVITHCHLDKAKHMMGYLSRENKVFLMDKSKNIVSYALLESVLQYQTAVVRKDFDTANEILPHIPKSEYAAVSRFLESQGFIEEALAVTDDADHKFDLALQLNNLDLACEVMQKQLSRDGDEQSFDIQQKWKKLGDLALGQANLSLTEECMRQSNDLSGLLLLYSSSANVEGIKSVVTLARKAGKINVAFTGLFIQSEIQECIDLLIESQRIPEAAFLARTYLPSKVDEVMLHWKNDLLKISKRAAHALASPSEYADRFPDLEYALKAEVLYEKSKVARQNISASRYSEYEHATSQDLIEAVKQLEAEGTLDKALNSNGDIPVESPVVSVEVDDEIDTTQEKISENNSIANIIGNTATTDEAISTKDVDVESEVIAATEALNIDDEVVATNDDELDALGDLDLGDLNLDIDTDTLDADLGAEFDLDVDAL